MCENGPVCQCSNTNNLTAQLPGEPIPLNPDDEVSVLIVPHEAALPEVLCIDDRKAVRL